MARSTLRYLVLTFLAQSACVTAQSASVQNIAQFAPGTWFENLAPRPNGDFLVTDLTKPILRSFHGSSSPSEASLVHTFDGYGSLIGITETYNPDVFALTASNFSFNPTEIADPHSADIWLVNYCPSTPGHPHSKRGQSSPSVSLLTNIADARFVNGLTYHAPSHQILAADSSLGVVFGIDVYTGASKILIQDPLMKMCAGGSFPIGINGVKYNARSSALYFTNMACATLNKIPLDPLTATAVGPATALTTFIAGIDDFDISPLDEHAFYVAVAGTNMIAEYNERTNLTRTVAGSLNSSEVAEPTAVRFGVTGADRARGRFYVSTAGGLGVPVNGTTVVGAQLVAVNLR